MKMRRILATSALSALLLTLPARADAQAPAPQSQRNRGLELTLGLGMSGCTDAMCAGFDPSASVRLHVLYRFMPYLAAGLHAGFFFGDPDRNLPDWINVGWQTLIGAEVRGILPVGPLEAWLGFAVGWMRMQVDSENDNDGDIDRWWTNGAGIGIGFGAQYFVIRQLALGLDFWLYKGFFGRQCDFENDGPVETENCWDLDDDEKAAVGVTFTFGLTATFFLSL